MRPDDGPPESRTVADEVGAQSSAWLRDGFDTLHAGVRDAIANDDTTSGRTSNTHVDVPPGSGNGRRVVFDITGQRVWIVGSDGAARSTYLVSGSRSDNLRPGRYEVLSRSRHAVGYGMHSTMEYFVRFARGKNAMIGFHDIPVDRQGEMVQSVDDLGTPQSAGCIRQQRTDAKRMWRFADLGTRVVVLR